MEVLIKIIHAVVLLIFMTGKSAANHEYIALPSLSLVLLMAE